MKESKEVNILISLNEAEAEMFATMCYDRIRVLAECQMDIESIQSYARCIERINEKITENKVKVSE